MLEKENFEKELKDLEKAVEKLEKGELPLEEAIKCFEDGVKSANNCRRLLGSVQTRVEQLLGDGQGGFKVEPLLPEDAPEETGPVE